MTRIERTMIVSSNTPNATTNPICRVNVRGQRGQGAEGAGEHESGGRDHATCRRQPDQGTPSAALAPCFFADARHQEDVVVDAERHEEDEREQRKPSYQRR